MSLYINASGQGQSLRPSQRGQIRSDAAPRTHRSEASDALPLLDPVLTLASEGRPLPASVVVKAREAGNPGAGQRPVCVSHAGW